MDNVYIHVPFCARKCRYCDFFSTEYDDSAVHEYLQAIEKHLNYYSENLNAVQTVYIGGGTPSVLSEKLIDQLLQRILKNMRLTKGYEFTIEVNPGTITAKKADILKRYGVNRVSIGIQALNDKLLSFLGRIHNTAQAEEALKIISNNFDNYSVDLIYGMPAQTGELWQETLRKILLYDPPHISAYELTPERETPLFKDIETGSIAMPDEDIILEMYKTCSKILSDNGFCHYEISSYARSGYESRHNENYWRRGEYIGIGPSAHSFLDGKRFKNVKDVSNYCRKLESGIVPLEEVIELSPTDDIKEIIMLGLRTRKGIDLADILHRVKREKGEAIDSGLISEGLSVFREGGSVKLDCDHIRLTQKGFMLSNAIIVEIIEALSLL